MLMIYSLYDERVDMISQSVSAKFALWDCRRAKKIRHLIMPY